METARIDPSETSPITRSVRASKSTSVTVMILLIGILTAIVGGCDDASNPPKFRGVSEVQPTPSPATQTIEPKSGAAK